MPDTFSVTQFKEKLPFMAKLKDSHIIIIFALLHMLVAVVSRLTSFNDELILTLLTMMMSIFLALQKRMNALFMTILIIIVNFLGMYMGTAFGKLMRMVIPSDVPYRAYFLGPICTFLVTMVLGWGQVFVSYLVKKKTDFFEEDTKDYKILFIALVIVMSIRLLIMLKGAADEIKENIFLNISIDYIFSFVCVLFMAFYTTKKSKEVFVEKEKSHKAQYSYQKLKQQIEPHFLFNSLNSLGGLIETEQNEQALLFTRKLAGLYRYMIENEEDILVFLEDEIHFVNMYVDLIKVRFPEGLDVSIDIPENVGQAYIVPCSIQMMVENATKHNAISKTSPLRISIRVEDDAVLISNNIQPKVSSLPSTGQGIKYVRNQYRDIAQQDIEIRKTDSDFTVKLPLLR